MSTNRRIASLTAAIFLGACAANDALLPRIGGVYVSEVVLDGNKRNLEVVFPVLAIRIDTIIERTLLVKYRFGAEKGGDADFTHREDCSCYRIDGPMGFSPPLAGREESDVFLTVKSPDRIDLWYISGGKQHGPFSYQLTYLDDVDLTTHRDEYYAEDSFRLFPGSIVERPSSPQLNADK